ncbi:hypothetical protein ACLOJK_024126 [Asimina triloba]
MANWHDKNRYLNLLSPDVTMAEVGRHSDGGSFLFIGSVIEGPFSHGKHSAEAESTLISPKRLAAIARRWQKLASLGRRRISMSKANVEPCKKSTPSKGHFVVYTGDGRRCAIPLAYHNSLIFQELFELSEDEYGLPCNGPITIPCDAAFMQYIVSFLQRAMPEDKEKALLLSMATRRCSMVSCPLQPQANPPMLVHGY